MKENSPTPTELSSFCYGMLDLHEFIRSQNPDLVLFPLRGAYPFHISYSHIASLNSETTPTALLLPLGTSFDPISKTEKGITKPKKFQVINSALDLYMNADQSVEKIVLVDEVQNGGTINTHYHMANRYLQQNSPSTVLKTCAIEHGKTTRGSAYEKRAERHGFHRIRVESLFVMDRPQFLPTIITNSDTDFDIDFDNSRLDFILEEIDRLH